MEATTSVPTAHDLPDMVFSYLDYILFAIMLGISAVIGIYFGCFGSKQATTKEYLLGGKTMKVFPVAMSLLASHISGIALLAVPTDVYRYGASYGLVCLSMIPISLITSFVYMPVIHRLQLTNTFEYIKMRFNSKVKILASVLFIISMLTYNPIVIYIPALAFAQVTGVHLNIITPIVCLVCIFYTTIGGLKAVVWTDALQLLAIIGGWAVIFLLGASSAGGFGAVWEISKNTGRLDIFDFDLGPTKRNTFWTVFMGMTITWIYGSALIQGSVQRFLSVPTLKDARRVVLIVCIGVITINMVSVFTGLIMYANYHGCDPITIGKLGRPDQILPYYIMDVAKNIPGLPGLFIAGIFSASLSTLSTTLNGVSATIYGDFISPFMSANITEKQTSNILKLIVVLFGFICTSLVFVVEHLGSILPLAISFGGMINGPLLGLFSLGMLVPFANSKGALCGVLSGLFVIGWIVSGAQYYLATGAITYPHKPLLTDNCEFDVNVTIINETSPLAEPEEPFYLYRVSYYYYCLIGTFTTMVIGVLVSWLTNKNEHPVKRKLLSPVIYPLLPTEENLISPT